MKKPTPTTQTFNKAAPNAKQVPEQFKKHRGGVAHNYTQQAAISTLKKVIK